MPSPALDSRPDTDIYTDHMTNSFSDIQQGCKENGAIPMPDIWAYWQMFEDEMVESKHDFLYLVHQMNQPALADAKEKLEKAKRK